MLPHIKDVFPRHKILHPEISITFVTYSHFFARCVNCNRLHPAYRCRVDMIFHGLIVGVGDFEEILSYRAQVSVRHRTPLLVI